MTLQKIETVLRENLQYSSRISDPSHPFHNPSEIESFYLLRKKATEIYRGYDTKQSKLCWLWRKIFSKKKRVEAIYNRLMNLTPPTVSALPLSKDCNYEILNS
ncbi:MAG: hypothetical protein ACSNEK_09475 [Parachlamydiaceae bacterium]